MAAIYEQFILRLPPPLKKQLREQARHEETSLNEKIIAILCAYCETDDVLQRAAGETA